MKAIGKSLFLSALSFQHLLFEPYEPICNPLNREVLYFGLLQELYQAV
jgi:hypothetical protein